MRICEKNNHADIKVNEEGHASGAGAEIPLWSMVKTMVRQMAPLKPMEVFSGADIHPQPMKDPMLEQGDAPKGRCDPTGSSCWSRLPGGSEGREVHDG